MVSKDRNYLSRGKVKPDLSVRYLCLAKKAVAPRCDLIDVRITKRHVRHVPKSASYRSRS